MHSEAAWSETRRLCGRNLYARYPLYSGSDNTTGDGGLFRRWKNRYEYDAGKNLIGTFHQPEAVIADSDFLRTLPEREIGAGIAEIIKHGVLADKTYFEELERDMEKLRALDPETVAEVVGRSCEIKAGVVSRDEKEKGERAKLNLGHTFGHAIEKLTGYGTWLHGEAVAVGTVLAAVTAEKQGKINCGDVKRIQDLIHRAGLPVRIAGISATKAIEAMKGDKKSTKGVPHLFCRSRSEQR